MRRRINRIGRFLRRRVRSERGSVGVLMALFIMVAIGSLVMTWNSVQVSKEKMRLQAAADSAALSACVWQARGMNTVQNINDDMYIMLSFASKLLNIATPIQVTGVGCWKMRFVWPVGPVFEVLAIAAFGTAMLLGGTASWMVSVCRFILEPLQFFYVNFSAAFGFMGALQIAAKNGASNLISGRESTASGNAYGLYTIGSAARTRDLFMLPLKKATRSELKEEDEDGMTVIDKIRQAINTDPWIRRDHVIDIWTDRKLVPSTVKCVHEALGTGAGWDFRPYVTPQRNGKNVLPSPVLYIVRRNADHIETIDMKWWDPDFQGRPAKGWPMMAVAAAQCITGDVVPHSVEPSNTNPSRRPAGFGTGATARLVPIREYARWANSTEGNANVDPIAIRKGIFH